MASYLRTFLIASVALLALILAFNRLIDPYAYWGGPIIEGVNRFKPASARHLTAVKVRQAARVQPVTIIAGNSRVDVGFDPQSAAWPIDMQPLYNLGLPGVAVPGLANVLTRILDQTRPQQVILALDFVDFRIAESAWRQGDPETITPAKPVWRERVELLLSLDALTDSVSALAEQHDRYPAHITAQGYNSLADYNRFVETEGHALLFAQRQQENMARYRTGPKAVGWPEPGRSAQWAALERIAAMCEQRGIKLTLITFPYHVTLMDGFWSTGLWPAFMDWQNQLAAFGARSGVRVVDFSRVTPETSEAVPAVGDTRTRMRWYWEGGHFKAALGDMIIADLARSGPQFGRVLTPANVDALQRETTASLHAYREDRARTRLPSRAP